MNARPGGDNSPIASLVWRTVSQTGIPRNRHRQFTPVIQPDFEMLVRDADIFHKGHRRFSY